MLTYHYKMALKSKTLTSKQKDAKNQKAQAQALLDAVIEGIREKKGRMIRQFDLSGLKHASTDYFIICHGDSQRQTVAIADSIEEFVRKKTGEKPWHTEGEQNAHWVLMDYVNVVVHIFYKEAREFYDIENLWADAVITEIPEDVIAPAKKESSKKPKLVAINKSSKSSIKKTASPSVKKPAKSVKSSSKKK